MENLLSRYRNVSILVAVLFAQVLGLAVQVRRSTENESSRLIRVWAVGAVSPLEKVIIWVKGGTSGVWHNYVYLRGVRQENRELRDQIERLRLEQVRMREDAEQARRLQALLGFKEQFISRTVAAQVIGSSGSDQVRSFYIDRGTDDGIKGDMPVITADGIVGKVLRVFGGTSQILLVNDQSSGAGVILEKSRLQGVLRGTADGGVILDKVMSDEQVQPGERVLTSGGDRIFPKGLNVGTVTDVAKGKDSFLKVRVKLAVNLSKLEEVLVITQQEERVPEVTETQPARAADILAQRLPSVPDKPVVDPKTQAAAADVAAKPNASPAVQPAPRKAPDQTPAATAPAEGAQRKPVSSPGTNPSIVPAVAPPPTQKPDTAKPDQAPEAPADAAPAEDKPH